MNGTERGMNGQLIRYEEMLLAVERCARIDEAADIKDRVAALQAHALPDHHLRGGSIGHPDDLMGATSLRATLA